jgi:protein required for attachment to host cells
MARSWIVVTDSARARIFDTDTQTQELSEITDLVHPQSRSRSHELNADRAGRTFDRVGGASHAKSKHVSPHEHEADLFARQIADQLTTAYAAGRFTRLRLSAPPAFLGILRKHLDDELTSVLDKTITKNLVQETPEAIAMHFFGQKKSRKSVADGL